MLATAAPKKGIVWLRRDLRLYDHNPVATALQQCEQVVCVFVFDTTLLSILADKADRRVHFIQQSVAALDRALTERGSRLWCFHGDPRVCIPQAAQSFGASCVFAGRDYEPEAVARDDAVAKSLAALGRELVLVKDQVIFEGDEVVTQAGQPFSVFTPYKRAWLGRLQATDFSEKVCGRLTPKLVLPPPSALMLPSLGELGFVQPSGPSIVPGEVGAQARLRDFAKRLPDYHLHRDTPAQKGTSFLSVHLRFGTVSLRELVRLAVSDASKGAEAWLAELVWRDFYFMILHHHPHVVKEAFKPAYRRLVFPNHQRSFLAWCCGETGYPLVDAGMRQLNTTGYMHNRLRMVTASFLVKDLLVDWRWGERYFCDKLVDYDLAANNGGWQWAASTGCDAQPYFRIFNPVTQSKRFDPEGEYIRRFVPELLSVPNRFIHEPWLMPKEEQVACGVQIGKTYPSPLVDHAQARQAALALYRAAAPGTRRL